MRNNWVREKLKAGEPTIGALLGLGSPHVAELMAHAGYDWLVIESEHNALDSAQIEHMLMAVSGTESIPLVRPVSDDPLLIQKACPIPRTIQKPLTRSTPGDPRQLSPL